jgi:carboxymethylenebutenolidase
MYADIFIPVTLPDKPSGIIVLQDAYGVNDQLREIARRFAESGVTAIAPELFHRTGDGIVGAYTEPDDALRRRSKDQLTREGQLADASAAYEWLLTECGVVTDRIAAIGFCLGGRVAFLANAALPLRAAISFYGGRIAPDLLDCAPRQHGELLMVWGGQDAHIPPKQRRSVEDALTEAGSRHQQVVFSQAKHAFFGHRHPDYSPEAAARAWPMVLEFLRSTNVID